MTDRVYPAHEAAAYPHVHHGSSPPSAPPLHGSTVAIQMPEKAVRKEQEKGLISSQYAQTRPNDDHVYAAPPPVYGTKGYAGESYALAPVGRRRRRRGGCCCCLISFAVTLGTLILIAGIAALVVYLVVRPVRKPWYEIQGVEVREFNVTNGGTSVLNTDMDLIVEANNPNKKIGIDYNDIYVDVYYEEKEIGAGSIPGFYQGHKNTTLLTIPIEGHDIALTSDAVSALQSNASMWLTATAETKARIKIGRWKSWRHTFHVTCSLHLSSSPHPGPLTITSSSCKLKKPKFYFLGIHF